MTAERSGGFAAVRGRIQALCRDLGVEQWHAEPLDAGVMVHGSQDEPQKSSSVTPGWVASVNLTPQWSLSTTLRVPINGAEFDVHALMAAVEDPGMRRNHVRPICTRDTRS